MSRGYCCFRSLLCLSHQLVPLHQMLDLWSYEEDTCIKPISSAGSTNHSDISAVMRLKIEKVGSSFSTFNPCPPLPFIATVDRKPSQCQSIKYCCTFQNHANSKVQKPTDICIFGCPQLSQPVSQQTELNRFKRALVCDWLISICFVCFCGSWAHCLLL